MIKDGVSGSTRWNALAIHSLCALLFELEGVEGRDLRQLEPSSKL